MLVSIYVYGLGKINLIEFLLFAILTGTRLYHCTIVLFCCAYYPKTVSKVEISTAAGRDRVGKLSNRREIFYDEKKSVHYSYE